MPQENISLLLFRDLCFLLKRKRKGRKRKTHVEEREGEERRKEGIAWQAPT